MDAPQKVMRQFKGRGRLERRHPAALRVHTRHHVLNRAVLTTGIHTLENNEQGSSRVGIESLLEPTESCDELGRGCLGLRFSFTILLVGAGVFGIDLVEVQLGSRLDAILFHGIVPPGSPVLLSAGRYCTLLKKTPPLRA